MDRLNVTNVKIIKGVLILNAVVCIIIALLFDTYIPFITGQIFGMCIAILNLRLLALTLQQAVNMLPGKAQAYVGSRYIIRYLLMAMVLFISIKADYINVIGTILGLISVKVIILLTNIIGNLNFFENITNKRKEEK